MLNKIFRCLPCFVLCQQVSPLRNELYLHVFVLTLNRLVLGSHAFALSIYILTLWKPIVAELLQCFSCDLQSSWLPCHLLLLFWYLHFNHKTPSLPRIVLPMWSLHMNLSTTNDVPWNFELKTPNTFELQRGHKHVFQSSRPCCHNSVWNETYSKQLEPQ